jgi:hypothetical protein
MSIIVTTDIRKWINDKGKSNDPARNLSQSHIIHLKSQTVYPGIKFEPPTLHLYSRENKDTIFVSNRHLKSLWNSRLKYQFFVRKTEFKEV